MNTSDFVRDAVSDKLADIKTIKTAMLTTRPPKKKLWDTSRREAKGMPPRSRKILNLIIN